MQPKCNSAMIFSAIDIKVLLCFPMATSCLAIAHSGSDVRESAFIRISLHKLTDILKERK